MPSKSLAIRLIGAVLCDTRSDYPSRRRVMPAIVVAFENGQVENK